MIWWWRLLRVTWAVAVSIFLFLACSTGFVVGLAIGIFAFGVQLGWTLFLIHMCHNWPHVVRLQKRWRDELQTERRKIE